MPSSVPKNNCLHMVKQIKKCETSTLWLLWTIETKNVKYISVYIKVKIVETSKYDLSYMRYYIVIAIRELIIFFGPLDDLKWKNYQLQSFRSHHSIQFWYKIWLHPRSYEKVKIFFCVELFLCRAMPSAAPKNAFVGTGEAMTRPYKCHYF